MGQMMTKTIEAVSTEAKKNSQCSHKTAPPSAIKHSHNGCCSSDHSETHVHEHKHVDEHATTEKAGCCSGHETSSSEEDSADDEESDSSHNNQRLSWFISGMDCPSCAKKIETAVQSVNADINCRVAFATEKLLVDIDKVNHVAEEIRNAVEAAVAKAGFTLQATNAVPVAVQDDSLLEQVCQHWHALILISSIVIAAVIGQFDIGSTILAPLNISTSQALFTFASIFGVIPVALRAMKLARSGTPFAIETLMSVATIGALILGETAESAMVLVLFMVGEKLESFAAGKARKGVKSLMSLVPTETTKVVDGEKVIVAVSELQPGDMIIIKPGDRLPADATLLDAGISFDESAITGESVPIEHNQDDLVLAGSLVVNRLAKLKVVSESGNNAIDRILHLIEEAEDNKAPIERFLDRFSRWYTPAMMVLAALVIILPPLLFAGDWNEWIYKGLALLLIACPCALVISTPAAVTSALSAASRQGVLIKGGAALEQLGNIQQIAFDKTGTLTQGLPEVTSVVAFERSEKDVLQLAASIEQTSNHPLAKAILAAAQTQSIDLLVVENDKTLAGLGVQGQLDIAGESQLVKLLAPHHMQELLANLPAIKATIAELENQGNTTILVTLGEQIVGLVALADSVREDARQAITALTALSVDTVMLTGDNQRTASVIAARLGMQHRAELLPEDKSRIVVELNQDKETAMVGDGINDAPAMKSAQIGIAMGGGTDVALEVADVALMHNRLMALPGMIGLGKATLANIKQNIMLAVGLKGLFLVTTLLGITGLWVAILADTGATALVTANALRLLRFNNDKI